MQGIGQIVQAIAAILPTPVLVALLVAVAWFGLPGYLKNLRVKKIKERVRRRVRADDAGRAALAEEAMQLAGTDVFLLEAVVAEARKRNQAELATRALATLDALGHGERLREAARAPRIQDKPPTAIATFIAGLLDEGLIDAARTHLEEALAAHPGHPALTALQQRLPPGGAA